MNDCRSSGDRNRRNSRSRNDRSCDDDAVCGDIRRNDANTNGMNVTSATNGTNGMNATNVRMMNETVSRNENCSAYDWAA